jgi:N-acetylglucosamine-6-phosphate deacetylase
VSRPTVQELRAAAVVTPDAVVRPGAVVVDAGVIAEVRPLPVGEVVPPRTLVPGFVDMQVNGHHDVDVAHAAGADWDRLDQHLLAQGVTTWCPTLVTAPLGTYPEALRRVAAASARAAGAPRPAMAGVHLEGPFLGGAPGAHPRQWLRAIDLEWLTRLPESVSVVTLAPELDGAPEAIAALARRGVLVSLGHSTATYDQAVAATDAGARLVTHLFNAMAPLHHREPGLVGAALADERLAVSLIADLVHVHPAPLRVAFLAKGRGGVALVTDAVAWRAGQVGELGITVGADGAPRLADGTLAGSALTMDGAVRNCVDTCGIPLAAVIDAAATTPARLLGLADRGALVAGHRADVVALSPTLQVTAVWVEGHAAWTVERPE